jgi:hypothetical protein
MNTDLEKKQTDDLYRIVKDKFKNPQTKDIDNIIHCMSHSLYHDNRVNDIYSKTAISNEVIRRLFIHGHKKLFEHADTTIQLTLEIQRLKKEKRKSCYLSCF